MSPPLTVEPLSGPDAVGDIAAEWDALDRQTSPRTPFTSPAYVVAWWKHFARRRLMLFRDEFLCHVVRDDEGRLVAVAPLMRTLFPAVGPSALRIVQFLGADPALTEIRGLVCRPEFHTKAVEALARHFLGRRGEWDVFRWTGLRNSTSAYRAPTPLSALAPKDELPGYIVDLPAKWDDLFTRLSPKMRNNLRRITRLLERDGIVCAFRVLERPNDVAAALERFVALHVARADAADMTDHENKFRQRRVGTFLSEYMRGAAERGELRIFELEVGGVTVASRCALLLGSDLYLHLAGYDPAWKAYSVMTVLMAEVFKWAIAQGLERVNLSTGADQSKIRWKPREVTYYSALQVSPTWRARPAFALFKVYEALSQARGKARKSDQSEVTNAPPTEGCVESVRCENWSVPPI